MCSKISITPSKTIVGVSVLSVTAISPSKIFMRIFLNLKKKKKKKLDSEKLGFWECWNPDFQVEKKSSRIGQYRKYRYQESLLFSIHEISSIHLILEKKSPTYDTIFSIFHILNFYPKWTLTLTTIIQFNIDRKSHFWMIVGERKISRLIISCV